MGEVERWKMENFEGRFLRERILTVRGERVRSESECVNMLATLRVDERH
jgi:hypothetical protein